MANIQAAIPAAKMAAPTTARTGRADPNAASFEDALSLAKPEAKADPQKADSDQHQDKPVAKTKSPAGGKSAARKATRGGRERKPETADNAEAAAPTNLADVSPEPQNVEDTDTTLPEPVADVDAVNSPSQVQAVPTDAVQDPAPTQSDDVPQADADAEGTKIEPLLVDDADAAETQKPEDASESEQGIPVREQAEPVEPALITGQGALPIPPPQRETSRIPVQDAPASEHSEKPTSVMGLGSERPALVESVGEESDNQTGEQQSQQHATADSGGGEVIVDYRVDRQIADDRETTPAKEHFHIEEHVSQPQAGAMPGAKAAEPSGKRAAVPATPVAAEVPFVEANHPNIVTEIRTHLLPRGGSMQIRLDPPELGALQVSVQIRDGVITASFQTSNDDATQLLSHSLHQLKQSLEVQGIAVDRLHVEQAPREHTSGGPREDGQQPQQQDQSAQQEQQRREMLQRMWRRLRGDRDPLDLTA